MSVHVTWNEVREDAYCFIIADLTADGWEFWERDSWEIRWFRMKATDELICEGRVVPGQSRNRSNRAYFADL